MAKQRIIAKVDDDLRSFLATVIDGPNRLLQKRQFAFDGRKWFYQHKKGQPFTPVPATEIPDPVLQTMSAETGRTIEQLRYPEL
jgi:hypothetical protein